MGLHSSLGAVSKSGIAKREKEQAEAQARTQAHDDNIETCIKVDKYQTCNLGTRNKAYKQIDVYYHAKHASYLSRCMPSSWPSS